MFRYNSILTISCFIILGFISCSKDEPKCPIDDEIIDNPTTPDTPSDEDLIGNLDGHEWVDLGLSVKWATCNIGAETPSEYGSYFCWSGTTPKQYFYSGECEACYKRRYELKSMGIIDSEFTLTPKYDAATTQWGLSWRMPTYNEILELKEKCSWSITINEDIVGYSATGPNGKSIFFPAAGHIVRSELREEGKSGSYWSSTPDNGVDLAYRLGFNIDDNWVYWGYLGRECGAPIRAVTQ